MSDVEPIANLSVRGASADINVLGKNRSRIEALRVACIRCVRRSLQNVVEHTRRGGGAVERAGKSVQHLDAREILGWNRGSADNIEAVEPCRLHDAALETSRLRTGDPSGLMRQKIENGAAVDVFASADMEQPRQLAAGHPERMVILFARNSLCAVARPNLALNEDNFLDRLLDPAVRIATSTPGSDPLGTYSWEVFARADALKPGARATLEAKAKKLVGGGEKTPPLVAGKGAVEGIFFSDQADVMLIYCSAVPALQSAIPSLTSTKLPATLTVHATQPRLRAGGLGRANSTLKRRSPCAPNHPLAHREHAQRAPHFLRCGV
jgi:hypothetical protein